MIATDVSAIVLLTSSRGSGYYFAIWNFFHYSTLLKGYVEEIKNTNYFAIY